MKSKQNQPTRMALWYIPLLLCALVVGFIFQSTASASSASHLAAPSVSQAASLPANYIAGGRGSVDEVVLMPPAQVVTPTDTPTPLVPTDTPSPTPGFDCGQVTCTPTPIATATFTPTDTPIATATFTPTDTPTATATFTPTDTATSTPAACIRITCTPTPSVTPSPTASATASATATPPPSSTPLPPTTPTPTATISRPIPSDTPAPRNSATAVVGSPTPVANTATPPPATATSVLPTATLIASATPLAATSTPPPPATLPPAPTETPTSVIIPEETPAVTDTEVKDPLQITKSADVGGATVGSNVNFTIKVKNRSNTVNLNNVVVTDTVPVQFTVNNVLTSRPAQVSINGNVVVVKVGTLTPGQSVTIRIETSVNADLAGGVSNIAYANANEVQGLLARITIRSLSLPHTGAGSPFDLTLLLIAALLLTGLGFLLRARRQATR